MKTLTVATVVGRDQPLNASELAHACGAEEAWVVQLVQIGIIEADGAQPANWRFRSRDLQRALYARRLQQDFDASLDAAALILDLSQEVRRLKARLHVLERLADFGPN